MRKSTLCLLAFLLMMSEKAGALEVENGIIAQSVSADACDDRLADDDTQTAENRAADKAALSAVKLSGIIQRHAPDLSANAIDVVAYRIIDEYMINKAHAVKLADGNRVCVKLVADVEMTSADLDKLVEEYEDSEAPAEQIADVVKTVGENTTLKPQSLEDKKLLYIKKMVFWNGNETNHYKDLLIGLFSNSEYFYVTDDASIADFVLTPRLSEAVVDELDVKNHKMQIAVELEVVMPNVSATVPFNEKQKHSILFASDKDEQVLADELVRKLLTKAAKEMSRKVDYYSAKELEKTQFN